MKLPALQYYFGGKEGLYLACADYVAENIRVRLSGAFARIEQILEAGSGREPSAEALVHLLLGLTDMLIGDAEPESWAMFVLREQARPTAAFETIFSRSIGPTADACARLFAAATGKPEQDEQVRVQAFVLIGQVLAFRTLSAAALRSIGWKSYGRAHVAAVKRAVASQALAAVGRPDADVDALLAQGTALGESGRSSAGEGGRHGEGAPSAGPGPAGQPS